MGQRHTLTKRCIEHSFVFVHFDLNPDGLKSNFVCRHTGSYSNKAQPCGRHTELQETKVQASYPCSYMHKEVSVARDEVQRGQRPSHIRSIPFLTAT